MTAPAQDNVAAIVADARTLAQAWTTYNASGEEWCSEDAARQLDALAVDLVARIDALPAARKSPGEAERIAYAASLEMLRKIGVDVLGLK